MTIIVPAKTKNNKLMDFQVLSRRQVELAYCIRWFRYTHDMTLTQLANRCSHFGKPFKIKFSCAEIQNYETLAYAPTEKKMNVLMMAIGIKMNDLDAYINKRK